MNNTITSLEETVLKLLASKAAEHRELLCEQINHAQVIDRQVTNVGFITNFSVPKSITRLTTMSKRKIFEIYAEHPHTHAGAEFLLWLENGQLKTLEGYVFIGQWPTTEEYKFYFHIHHDSLCADLVRKKDQNYQYV